MSRSPGVSAEKPVLIIGAGICGLVLAQRLRKDGIPFRIFERDPALEYRGVGWGLTLNWSLPDLRELLPPDLVTRFPEAYVDRVAVDEGKSSKFPFFDLSTGELKAATPTASSSSRVRVLRQKLRELLLTEVNVEWNKQLQGITIGDDSVTANFKDGSSAEGVIAVGCDGAQSKVRQALLPETSGTYEIPVRMLGVKMHLSPNQMKPILDLDPFFLQGTSSQNNSFVYVSLLDAPRKGPESPQDKYVCQMCVSWPYREGFLGRSSPTDIPDTKEERYSFVQELAGTWAEPFRALARNMSAEDEIKDLIPHDFVPPQKEFMKPRVVLMGDALHAMAMFRGEGANHGIVDVSDFVEHILPCLLSSSIDVVLEAAVRRYEKSTVSRVRPGVLASRRACLDAHEWSLIGPTSPLLTRREKNIQFTEEE